MSVERMIELTATEPVPEISLVNLGGEDAAADWAGCINKTWGGAAAKVVEAGRHLIAAKATLPHGDWERMFKGHPQAVKNPLRFGVATAQHLMAIARHPVLGNTERVQLLPPSWGTLYQLSRLSAIEVEVFIAEGKINPEMSREEAVILLPPPVHSSRRLAGHIRIKAALEGRMGWKALEPHEQPPPADIAAHLVRWRQVWADIRRNEEERKALELEFWKETGWVYKARYGGI
jgi:hypothetical protein